MYSLLGIAQIVKMTNAAVFSINNHSSSPFVFLFAPANTFDAR
jgi:hypothetical protein